MQDWNSDCLLWYCQKHSWSQHLTLSQSRAGLRIFPAICVVTPGVKCLQTVRAIQGWTHPVSRLEKPVMNHQGLMNAVLRIMHGCRRQHPNSPQKWADCFQFFFLVWFFPPWNMQIKGVSPALEFRERGFLGPWLWHLIWEGSLTWC